MKMIKLLLFFSLFFFVISGCTPPTPTSIPDETSALLRHQLSPINSGGGVVRRDMIVTSLGFDQQNNLYLYQNSDLYARKFLSLFEYLAGYETTLGKFTDQLGSVWSYSERFNQKRDEASYHAAIHMRNRHIQVDEFGNVYIAQEAAGEPKTTANNYYTDVVLYKIDSTGIKQWEQRIDVGSVDSNEKLVNLSLDSIGRPILTVILGERGPNHQLTTIVYDAIGTEWIQKPGKIYFDNSGAFYTLLSGVIEKFDAQGNLLWTNNAEAATELQLDSLGNLYLTYIDPNKQNFPYVQKWNPNGLLQWQWDSTDHHYRLAAISQDDALYWITSSLYYIKVLRVNAMGQLDWEYNALFNESLLQKNTVWDVLFDSKNRLYLCLDTEVVDMVFSELTGPRITASWTSVVVLDPLGKLVSTVYEPNLYAIDFSLDRLDNLYMLGYDFGYLPGYEELFQNKSSNDAAGHLLIKHNIDELLITPPL